MRPATWQAQQGELNMMQRPVGIQGDAFDAMFGGMGAARTHVSTPPAGVVLQRPAVPPVDTNREVMATREVVTTQLDRGSEVMTSSNERSMDAGNYLHPDTLRPMPAQPSPTMHAQHSSPTGGWAVGFVVADGGVIRRVVPDTPADKAILQRESAAGIWQVIESIALYAQPAMDT